MSTIKVFGRIRPPRSKGKGGALSRKTAEYVIDSDDKELHIRAKAQHSQFGFNGKVFGPETTQEDIFETVAEPVIDSVLKGFNGTIFAYGQSGSGKTYSMTGAPASYKQRGIIPRALNKIFEHIESSKDTEFVVRVSYMEIYKDRGYDLLDPNHEPQQVEDLPKIVLRNDASGNVHLTNLNSLSVATREQALNHLFVGDTNRMICETANNDLSSRSHCVFTVYIQAKAVDSPKVRISKLNLVDLAGSERSKTVNDGLRGGARVDNAGINLSLHHLANVIVALHRKAKGLQDFVPYRNSMLTSILKDSLGGNCMTTMIATLSLEETQIPETISTCRFAQRVAAIPNRPIINEAVDPKAQIDSLQRQLEAMREKDEKRKKRKRKFLEPMTESERYAVTHIVQSLLDPDLVERDVMKKLMSAKDRRVGSTAFSILRNMVLQRMKCSNCGSAISWTIDIQNTTKPSILETGDSSDEASERKLKSKAETATESGTTEASSRQSPSASEKKEKTSGWGKGGREGRTGLEGEIQGSVDSSRKASEVDWEMHKEGLEQFRKESKVGRTMADNERDLRQCHTDAKHQGLDVEVLRERVNVLKGRLEEVRARSESTEEKGLSEDEVGILRDLKTTKAKYKEAYQRLKHQKSKFQHHLHIRKRLEQQLKASYLSQLDERESGDRKEEMRRKSESTVAWDSPPKKEESRQVRSRKPADKKALFEQFRKSSQIGKRVTVTREIVTKQMARAKELTRLLNAKRDIINGIKKQLEQERLKTAVQTELVDSKEGGRGQESELIEAARNEKTEYKILKREYDAVKEAVAVGVKKVEIEQKQMASEFRAWVKAQQDS